jgi:hypothetical protein
VPSEEASESQKYVRTSDTRNQRGNATCEKTGLLSCLGVEFLSLSASCISISSVCAAPVSSMCSTQSDNNSRKLRLRCGCRFPWCDLALIHLSTWNIRTLDTNRYQLNEQDNLWIWEISDFILFQY